MRAHYGIVAGLVLMALMPESSGERPQDDPGHHRYRRHRGGEHQRIRHHLSRRHLNYRHEIRFTENEYQQTVPETIPPHTSILTVEARDPGLEAGEVIHYHVSDSENFGVDEAGVLYNLRPLDHERTRGRYQLQVTAEAKGGARQWGRRKAVAKASVYVTDAPEPPYFNSSHYYYSIPEFAAAGTYVGRVSAYDDDNDLDSYILDGVDPPEMFTMDHETGVISVGLTPSGKKWVYHFRAGAIDYHGHVTQVPITVYIIASSPSYARLIWESKENRHKPVFHECSSYDQIHVKENMTAGSPVLLVLATDEDTGKNGAVSYTLINDFGSFSIHTSGQHGQVTTTRRLDRDGGDKEFFLTVIARDGAAEPLQDSCSFRLLVEDINDNTPIFDQPVYEATLAADHRPGTTILRVTASDKDAGDNAQISYSLKPGQDPSDLNYFSIDDNTGIMSLARPLDEAMANSRRFEVLVRATDRGRPALWSEVGVSITVVSQGELPPSIVSQDPPHPAIPENTTENTPVVTVCARSNIPESPNVYFTLINGKTRAENFDGTFALRRLPDNSVECGSSAGTSIFVATRNLDYETVQEYHLLLQVVNDQNARVDKKIKVTIQDVNDNAPLLQPFDGAVVENAASALITTIQALDRDSSPQFRQLSYTFDKTATSDVRSKFELKSNGELWTRGPLDRETTRQYRVPIQVTDGVQEHERMTIYWITVQDLNDVAPVFALTAVLEVELPENREVGKPTGIKLPVIDPDIVNQIAYEIVEGNEQQKFRIDAATGDVLVNKALDFDHPVFDRNFTMRVRVSDGANAPAETDITIAVSNVNDLQPVFQRANYTFSVTENTDCNVTFGKVAAIDPDLPPSAPQNILYYLSPVELRNFSIGATSGELAIKGCLDREAATRGTVTLYPRANDEGGRGHDADPSTVHMVILDLNDNHPYIKTPDRGEAVIRENLDPEKVDPIVVVLDDLDTEPFGCPCTMEYHKDTPPAVRDKFTITQGEGSRYEVRPLVPLDREEMKQYRLAVVTQDRQGVSGTRHITVTVADTNDSPMTDGSSTIKVYNYQGQFSSMVIGAVHVTDEDDHDLADKTFELDATTASDVATHFEVDHNTGNITMHKGTPAGTHILRVKVEDHFRGERAMAEVTIVVVDLSLDAVMQSGSLRLADVTTNQMLQRSGVGGRSLYERLKGEIALVHGIDEDQVDVFTLRDVPGGVDVRYNCHSSPYYTAARLDGILLQRRHQVEEALGVEIPMVDINLCLYEGSSPCGGHSCQHTMRPNLTAPLVVRSDTTSMVGLDIADDYTCDCGALEPLPSVCFNGFCHNGGTCLVLNNTLTCTCPDHTNYGPRCELLTARFERGFAWYEPPNVCENSTLTMVFETNEANGVLLYIGPTVLRPWQDYPKDFLYVFLREWVLHVYMELGSGTFNISLPLEENTSRSFEMNLTWDKFEVILEVADCGINSTLEVSDPCRKTSFLPGPSPTARHLLNVQGPMQVGGTAAMPSFQKLTVSYGWTLTPPAIFPFSGCVLELRHNDHLYDLNATDYSKRLYQPCDAPRTSRVVLGQQSVIIILASLLCLLLLVLVILCLARRGRKSISYPDLDRELVKETMGGADVEGFGEKDVTNFDLKFLQVTPEGYLLNDEDDANLPDVAADAQHRGAAPLATMPDGLSIGDYITEHVKKVDDETQDVDDVRHYNVQGDVMSAASLSSLASGLPSTAGNSSTGTFDYRHDWGQRFEKLAAIYGPESELEEDSEFEFADIPDVPKNYELRNGSTSVSNDTSQTDSLPTVSTNATNGGSTASPGDSGDGEPGRDGDGPRDGDRPGLRTNKEPVTKRIEYKDMKNPLASVNGVSGKETWC